MNTIDYSKQLVNLSTASANNFAARAPLPPSGRQFATINHDTSQISGSFHSRPTSGVGHMRPFSAYLGQEANAKQQAQINAAAANQKFLRPQTAFTHQSESTVMSARPASASQGQFGVRGHSLKTISYSAEKSSAFGVEGYKIPYHGLPPREPKYTIPKDKLQNFLAQTQKKGKAMPAPNYFNSLNENICYYHKPASWETTNGQFGKSAKRKTFTDDAIKHSKAVPAPNIYNTDRKRKIPLGNSNKTEGFDFMSEAQYLGHIVPAPTQYNPEKSKEADHGTYEAAKSKNFTKSKEPNYSFPKSKSLKFTVDKKHIPSSATYKYEPCFDKIAIPYMKKRY